MKYSIILTMISPFIFAQTINQKLEKSTREIISSPEMISANLSFYVSDNQGNVIYDYQGNKGLSTASTQKIFTAISALELLGNEYQYSTKVSYSGEIVAGKLEGNLVIFSNGDPTLGSWRYDSYKPEDFKRQFLNSLRELRLTNISGDLIIKDDYFDFQNIPNGWPWGDAGNYYGAGVWGVNWRENQFDINIMGGQNIGNSTQIKSFSYPLQNVKWVNETTSHKGNGDKSIIYTAPHSEVAYINGSLPMGKVTSVSGSVPNPPLQLGVEIKKWLQESGIHFNGEIITASQQKIQGKELPKLNEKEIFTYYSPKMEQIVYWFMRKSVNLYGETIVKTLAKTKANQSDFQSGLKVLKDFWKSKNIHPAMINFADGSGLSPQNYASAKAEVQALLWAKKQKWFPTFYQSFPTYNGMKMKSGTIKDVKAYTGYHTSKSGKEYVFSVIVNNYHGYNVNEKLFRLLDNLK